jgi:acyl-CoA thioester hydrolase
MTVGMKHQTVFDVYIKDVDLLGIVYHPRYIEWAASAREKLLRDQNFSFAALEQLGVHLATKKIEVSFNQMAKLADQLLVETTLQTVRKDRLQYLQKIFNTDGKLIAQIISTSIAIDHKTKKIAQIPETILQQLKKYANK